MIKVSVLYPSSPGRTFNMDYYCDKHMPLVQEKLGTACKSMAVEQGLSGATPGSQPAFVAMGHMYFDTLEAFQAAFAPVADVLIGDIPNYTDIEPTFQVSEVKL